MSDKKYLKQEDDKEPEKSNALSVKDEESSSSGEKKEKTGSKKLKNIKGNSRIKAKKETCANDLDKEEETTHNIKDRKKPDVTASISKKNKKEGEQSNKSEGNPKNKNTKKQPKDQNKKKKKK